MQFNERHILSPDYMSDITVYGYTFKSLRQAYADFKAILGGRHDDWVHQRASILRTLAILKFTQNLEAAQALISTRNEELIYAPTYHDSFLGIGNGDGQNVYGHILQEIRSFMEMWKPGDSRGNKRKDFPVVYSNYYERGYDRHIVKMNGRKYEFDHDMENVAEICSYEDIHTGDKSTSSVEKLGYALDECMAKEDGEEIAKLVITSYLRNIGLINESEVLRQYWGC